MLSQREGESDFNIGGHNLKQKTSHRNIAHNHGIGLPWTSISLQKLGYSLTIWYHHSDTCGLIH